MDNFDTLNILFYCFFVLFVYSQQEHLRNFHGSFKKFGIILSIFSSLGFYIGIVFLIYYGFKTVWWAPLILLIFSILIIICTWILGRFVIHGLLWISILGLVGWPILAFFMFASIPVTSSDSSSLEPMFFLLGGLLFLFGFFVLVSAREYKFRHLGLTFGGLAYLIGGLLTINLLSWWPLIGSLSVGILIKHVLGDEPTIDE